MGHFEPDPMVCGARHSPFHEAPLGFLGAGEAPFPSRVPWIGFDPPKLWFPLGRRAGWVLGAPLAWPRCRHLVGNPLANVARAEGPNGLILSLPRTPDHEGCG